MNQNLTVVQIGSEFYSKLACIIISLWSLSGIIRNSNSLPPSPRDPRSLSSHLDPRPILLFPSLYHTRIDHPPIVHLPPTRVHPAGRLSPTERVEKVFQVGRVRKGVACGGAARGDQAAGFRFPNLSRYEASATVDSLVCAFERPTCSIVVEFKNINYIQFKSRRER